MGPHTASLGLATSYFKATILPTFLFLFIFKDAEKEDKAEGKGLEAEL
jgi:hypothetical protein